MKTTYITTLIICLLSKALVAQSTLTTDTRKSIINWTGHAQIGSYAPAGTLIFKSGQAYVSSGTIKNGLFIIDMKSMKQENDHLLEHLKSSDFFDVDKYPVSSIRIARISGSEAYGKLTIKGKTLPFHCPVIIRKDSNGYIISGTAVIDRTSYGILYNSDNFFSGLGDKAISNNFDVTFTLYLVQ